MKRILFFACALLCSVMLSGQSKTKLSQFRSNPEKDLYLGAADTENILTGQQEALAMALTEFSACAEQKLKGRRVSSTTEAGTEASPLMEFAGTSMHYCDIEVVDKTTIEGTEYILFRIVSGGRYKVELNTKMMSIENDNEVRSSLETILSLKLTDPSGKENLLWQWIDVYLIDNNDHQRTIASSVNQIN